MKNPNPLCKGTFCLDDEANVARRSSKLGFTGAGLDGKISSISGDDPKILFNIKELGRKM